MKSECVLPLVLLLLAASAGNAFAIKPFSDAFNKLYAQKGMPLEEKAAAAKCNVCHEGMGKKVRNDFGKAVGKYLKKSQVGEGKAIDPATEKGQLALAAGLEKAVAEKSKSGKTFDELIKAGELPGAK